MRPEPDTDVPGRFPWAVSVNERGSSTSWIFTLPV